MSRTRHHRGRRFSYDRELTPYRRAHMRQWRARCRQLMRVDRWDELPRYRRTEGWLTW